MTYIRYKSPVLLCLSLILIAIMPSCIVFSGYNEQDISAASEEGHTRGYSEGYRDGYNDGLNKAEDLIQPEKETWLLYYSGQGDKTTESFIVTEAPWRITWDFDEDTYRAGHFTIQVHDAKDSSYVESIAGVDHTGADESYIYQEGSFYLDITSINGSWEVSVYGNQKTS